MKAINEMTYDELKEEIKFMATLLDDDTQARHSAAYLMELAEAFAQKVYA